MPSELVALRSRSFREARHLASSRVAAQEYSPRRKPWVKWDTTEPQRGERGSPCIHHVTSGNEDFARLQLTF